MKKNNKKTSAQGNTGRKSGNEQTARTNIIYCVRPNLSRRSRALVMLLQNFVPEDVIEHLEHELATETRSDQNKLVEHIFARLVESYSESELNNTRLTMKLIDLANRIMSHIDPLRIRNCE